MKNPLPAFLAWLLPLMVQAQSFNFPWAVAAGGSQSASANAVARDPFGNTFITGNFTSASINFGIYTLTNMVPGYTDFFIAKIGPSGMPLWAFSAGGFDHDEGIAVSTDATGSVYVTGRFQSDSITFGSFTLYNNNAFGYAAVFTVRYDANGNVAWADAAGGLDWDEGLGIIADSAGNAYICGTFSSPVITFGAVSLVNNGGTDLFLAKYNAAGMVQWAISAGGSNYEYLSGLVMDPTGSLFAAGSFSSDTLFLGNDTLTSSTYFQALLVKFDSGGNLLWGQSVGAPNYETYGQVVMADENGAAYLAGRFSAGNLIVGSDTLVNAGSGTNDIFLARFDSNGNSLWARQAGGTNHEECRALAGGTAGIVHMAGYFRSPSCQFGSLALSNNGTGSSSDLFLTQYDYNGNVHHALQAGGPDDEGALAVSFHAGGTGMLAGYFGSPSLSLGSNLLTNAGNQNLFVAAFSGCSSFFTVQPDTVPHVWLAANLAHGEPPLTYTWDWGDGNISPGAYPSHTYANPGYYQICLTITDALGCTDTYCDSSTYLFKGAGAVPVTVIVIGPVGISESADPAARLRLYPNPATDQLTLNPGGYYDHVLVEIFDLPGKLKIRSAFMSQAPVVDIRSLASGHYLAEISLETGGRIEKKRAKFIKLDTATGR